MRLKKFFAVLVLMISSSCFADEIYTTAPTFSPYTAGSVRSDVLSDALDELNYIRGLIGVPSVELNDDYTNKAQHGAVLLDAINTLTHTPGKPSDMDIDFYSLGYEATSRGNIAGLGSGLTISMSTKLFMNDSDKSNISALGHRRWLMNPRMKYVGFGISTRRGYAVTYVIPESYSESWTINDEYITWPVNKTKHPLKYFDSETAWSVTINQEIFDTASYNSITIRLTRKSDGKIWLFSSSGSNGYFNVNTQGYAVDNCIIFRPDNISYSAGDAFTVEVSGLTRKDGNAGDISYSVEFTGSGENTDTDSSAGNGDSGGCNISGIGIVSLLVLGLFVVRSKKVFVLLLVIMLTSSALYASDSVYTSAPTFSPYRAGAVRRDVLESALKELNYIRGLVGVPAVKLNDDYTNRAQHGAVLLDALNALSHTPGKPTDMDKKFYDLAYDATSHGNLLMGQITVNGRMSGNMNLIKALRDCMNDSDSYNIARVGHRRWLMNPRMKQVGFGLSTRRGYAVTYVIEEFSSKRVLSQKEYQEYLRWKKWPINDEYITWPARKFSHPLQYFDAKTAWSVTLNSDIFDEINSRNLTVKLTRQSDGRIWNFSMNNSDGYFTITDNTVAYDQCIIFRPNNVKAYNSGEVWKVDISGLTRGSRGRTSINLFCQVYGLGEP